MVAAAALSIPAAVLMAPNAFAATQLTLTGSNFQIDEDANLKVDAPSTTYPQSVDWASLAQTGTNPPEVRATDKPTGQNDDSYKGGVKEDDTCPGETTGSIPNNKSDLLTFHVNEEAATTGNKGFLNLAWSRVSDPSGTTLMDFEFNQSSTGCAGSPNKQRTGDGSGPGTDDLLIEYAIDQGGSRATITKRDWSGSAWGPAVTLSTDSPVCGGGPCAVGTINQSPIPANESDGLIDSGSKSARTFGEAQIDLRLIFNDAKCVSFGSAMIKSRSSDAFTSQLKDFISPVGIDLKNCGKVIIRKQTLPDESPNTTSFSYTKAFSTDPATSNSFNLTDDGVQTFNNVLFGSNYTVTEGALPTGWAYKSLDCSASTGIPALERVVDDSARKVTFKIDSENDVLDCTYTNEALGTVIVKKVINDGDGTQAFAFTTTTLPGGGFSLTPTATGVANAASKQFNNLSTGTTYDVNETVPSYWNLVSSKCDDSDSTPDSIKLSAGETVTCTFVNARERGAIKILKQRKHAADGPGDHPHSGVTFTVKGGELPAAGLTVQTGADGTACLSDLVVSGLVGNYSVTESVPAGYVALSTNPQTGIAVSESTCGAGKSVDATFHNMPLTDVTVSVNSQVDGGTASTITCDPALPNPDAVTGANGDGSLTLSNKQPGTYTCTIVVDP